MSDAEDFLAEADDNFSHGRFKEAHIGYGRALSRGSTRQQYCRQMRGACSRRVAEQRLAKAVADEEARPQLLLQSARWLAKAEANLDSALEDADPAQQGHIRLEQARNEESLARFMEMSGGDPSRRLALADEYRAEGNRMLAEYPDIPAAGPDAPTSEPVST